VPDTGFKGSENRWKLRLICHWARSMSDDWVAWGSSVRTMAMASHGMMVSKIHSQLLEIKVLEWYSKASRCSIAAIKTLCKYQECHGLLKMARRLTDVFQGPRAVLSLSVFGDADWTAADWRS